MKIVTSHRREGGGGKPVSPNDTQGSKISQKSVTYFLNGPYDAKISEKARRWPLTKTPLPFVRKQQMED